MTANHALQANGGGPSRLPSARIGAAVAELTSLVGTIRLCQAEAQRRHGSR